MVEAVPERKDEHGEEHRAAGQARGQRGNAVVGQGIGGHPAQGRRDSQRKNGRGKQQAADKETAAEEEPDDRFQPKDQAFHRTIPQRMAVTAADATTQAANSMGGNAAAGGGLSGPIRGG